MHFCLFYDYMALTIGFEDPTLVAISGNVSFKNYDVPLQAHLALSDDPTEMLYVMHESVQ